MSDVASGIVDLLDTWSKLKKDHLEKYGINPEYWTIIRDKDNLPVAAIFVNNKKDSLPTSHANQIEDAINDTLPHYFSES